jgi:hypothetical protein
MADDIRLQATKAQARGALVSGDIAAQKGAGWIGFSSIMLGLAGVWNVLEGLLAIGNSRVYVGEQKFIFSDLQTWGWIVLILGALLLVAAFAIPAGKQWARYFGIFAAGINMIGQLAIIHANPWWAMAMFTVDVLIIYGLVVYGGQRYGTE